MDLSIAKLIRYPDELSVKLGDTTYTAEDYERLCQTYGKHSVMVLRNDTEINPIVVTTGIVKVGILGKHMKAIPTAVIAKYLSANDCELVSKQEYTLVCTPPIGGREAYLLSEMMSAEEHFLEIKYNLLFALDTVLGCDQKSVDPIVQEIIQYIWRKKEEYPRHGEIIPSSEMKWSIYGSTVYLSQEDHISEKIKGILGDTVRLYPPLPLASESEVEALLNIHDLLVRNGMEKNAMKLISNALTSPMFAHLCHIRELFSKDRIPQVQISWDDYGVSMFQNLLSEEITCTARYNMVPAAEAQPQPQPRPKPIDLSTPYVLTFRELIGMGVPNAPLNENEAIHRLNTFVGGYLPDLDLSRTFITGSAIAASLIITEVENVFNKCTLKKFLETKDATPVAEIKDEVLTEYIEWCASHRGTGFKKYLASHYPTTRTVPYNRAEYLAFLLEGLGEEENLVYKTTIDTNGDRILTMTLKRKNGEEFSTTLHVLDGADVDMAIPVESDEEFDEIVRSHYTVIKRHYPEVALEQVLHSDDRPHSWKFTCEKDIRFRPVELYRANFDTIASHHFGMTSGAYTAVFSKDPQFVMTSRLVLSMAQLKSPNYYFFKSKKTAPQYIFMKYKMRGFDILDTILINTTNECLKFR